MAQPLDAAPAEADSEAGSGSPRGKGCGEPTPTRNRSRRSVGRESQAPRPLDPGAVFHLVQFLDFSPRHRDLAVRLARRFALSRAAQAFGALDLSRIAMREAYLDSFYVWLLQRVVPNGVPKTRAHGLSPSPDELRLLGLLDQYRSGQALRRVSDGAPHRRTGHGLDGHRSCPLEHAAYSPEA